MTVAENLEIQLLNKAAYGELSYGTNSIVHLTKTLIKLGFVQMTEMHYDGSCAWYELTSAGKYRLAYLNEKRNRK